MQCDIDFSGSEMVWVRALLYSVKETGTGFLVLVFKAHDTLYRKQYQKLVPENLHQKSVPNFGPVFLVLDF